MNLEKTVGRRVELRRLKPFPEGVAVDADRPLAGEPRVDEAGALRHRQKVVPIERAAETLALGDRVVAQIV